MLLNFSVGHYTKNKLTGENDEDALNKKSFHIWPNHGTSLKLHTMSLFFITAVKAVYNALISFLNRQEYEDDDVSKLQPV
jgi:hypothetical protein